LVGLSVAGSLGAGWLILAALISFWRRDPMPALATVLCVVVADLAAMALKLLTDRPRPYVAHPEQEPLRQASLDVSLPSGHAATSFAAAVVLARYVPARVAPLLFVLAALVAWSRVYVGVHYPSDVVAGALLGVAVGLTVPRLLAGALRRSRPVRPPG
jgi:undecaprenyl-diphosphatase